MSFLRQAPLNAIREGISVLQLNVEGLTKAKVNIIEHLLQTYKVTAVLLQETHIFERSKLNILGFTLAAYTASNIHGIATFVRNTAKWKLVAVSSSKSSVEWVAIHIEGVTVVNVYKPPASHLQVDSFPVFDTPCIYAGDFNCHSTTWGYSTTNPDGDALEYWASMAGLQLLFDPKQPASFLSGRWNTKSNPDLAFTDIKGATLHRIILDPFPKSHHRPSLIIPENPIQPIPTKPVKRWNFRKANWVKFANMVDKETSTLPKPDPQNLNSTYSAFCDLFIRAAKTSIPRGFRRHFIPSWDEEQY